MLVQRIPPNNSWHLYVKSFLNVEVDVPQPIRQVYPASTSYWLNIPYGDPLCNVRSRIVQPIDRLTSPFICCMNLNHAEIHIGPRFLSFSMELTPFGFNQLFSIPTSQVANSIIMLEDIMPTSDVARLQMQIEECPNSYSRVVIMESFLEGVISKTKPNWYNLSVAAKRIIEKNNGLLNVTDLVGLMGVSERTLRRTFKEQVGVSPKVYSRLMRYFSVSQQIMYTRNYTELAYRYGFYDQSHFINEFRHFTGYAPSEYRMAAFETSRQMMFD